MSLKLYWTPTGGHTELQSLAHLLPRKPLPPPQPRDISSTLQGSFTSLASSPCIFDIISILQGRWQRQYLLPTMPLSGTATQFWAMDTLDNVPSHLHLYLAAALNNWSTYTHMLHLNIPDRLEGCVFQNPAKQSFRRALWQTLEMGQELNLCYTPGLWVSVSAHPAPSPLTYRPSKLQTLPLKR